MFFQFLNLTKHCRLLAWRDLIHEALSHLQKLRLVKTIALLALEQIGSFLEEVPENAFSFMAVRRKPVRTELTKRLKQPLPFGMEPEKMDPQTTHSVLLRCG